MICSAYSDHSWEEMTAAFGKTDRVLILKKPFDTVEVRQLAHALQRRWELARLATLRVEDLTAVIDAQTRELKAANEALKREAAAREDALRRLGESNEQIRALAYQDGLTGLPNRRLFNEHLEKVLARARRKGTEFAVLFIDIDNFKLINDTIGHQAADEVLQQARRSLALLIRSDDVLGLYLDDEVDVVGHDHDRADQRLRAVAARRRRVHHPVARHARPIRGGHGRAANPEAPRAADPRRRPRGVRDREHRHRDVSPRTGSSSEILIRNADTAMYHAKQQGKAAFQYYSAAMNAASVERLTLESGLRRALEDGSLELHYQPQVDVRTGRIVGAEALLRWQSPAARLHLADNVHPDRRGLGVDPADRRMGARAALAARRWNGSAQGCRRFRSP